MAIEKRISLTIDTSSATAQIKKLQDAMSGVETTASKTKTGDTYTGATTGAKTARKALIDYTGSLSNANRLVIQSSNYATLAEKATLAQDTALRKLNQAYDQGRIDVTAYNAAVADVNSRFSETTSTLNRTTTATGQATSGFKVMRGGLTQLSYQLQDVAVQAQMGTSWFTIIGQQGPQIASILGPFGALLGIVVAVGAALGGVLFKSLNLATDATDELEKAMTGLDSIFKESKDGVISYADSLLELKQKSDSASELKIALALYDAQAAVASASKTIASDLEDLSSAWNDFSDLDFDESTKDLNELGRQGITTFEEFTEKVEEMGSVVSQRGLFNGILSSVSDLHNDFGIAEESAFELIQSVARLQEEGSKVNFDNLNDSLLNIANNDLANATDEQREAFIRMAASLSEVAIQGAKGATILELLKSNSIVNSPAAFALPFTNAAVATANLNSEFNSTSLLLLDIQSEYERLNELQQENSSVDIETAKNQARQNSISLIADEISGLDSIADREAFINEISERGLDLSGQEIDALMDRAQATKYLYEEQLAYNNSLSDNLSILGEIAGQGAKDYADSVKSINVELQGLVTSTFSSMEDALVSWAETGKASFSDFVNSALSDLLRLIVRQQLAGIATGITGAFSTGAGDVSVGAATTTSAKGNVITPSTYAKGGVTGMANTIQSTPKYFANGGGLLGEAGSEAIIPLTRTSGGDLGVKMTGSGGSSTVINYNVTNEAGIESTQSQSTNEDGSIDINVINKLVSKSIASGYADKAITGRFNTSKRGK